MDTGTLDSHRVRAIRARLAGIWDDPALLSYEEGAVAVDLLYALDHILTAPDPREKSDEEILYVEAARALFEEEGKIEIDDDVRGVTVSKGDDPGAYVSAWLWVPEDEVIAKDNT